jgi:hypothetical protein
MDDFPDKPSTREAVMPKTNNKKRKCQQEFVEWSSTAPNTF